MSGKIITDPLTRQQVVHLAAVGPAVSRKNTVHCQCLLVATVRQRFACNRLLPHCPIEVNRLRLYWWQCMCLVLFYGGGVLFCPYLLHAASPIGFVAHWTVARLRLISYCIIIFLVRRQHFLSIVICCHVSCFRLLLLRVRAIAIPVIVFVITWSILVFFLFL